MSNPVIRAVFETRLKTWADAQSTPVPVAWENVAYVKQAGTMFLEPILIPNDTMNLELSGKRSTYQGLFQINCWAPKGTGMGKVETMAQTIIDLFPLLPKVGAVSIEGTPFRGRQHDDGSDWVIVPVLIKYRYEAT